MREKAQQRSFIGQRSPRFHPVIRCARRDHEVIVGKLQRQYALRGGSFEKRRPTSVRSENGLAIRRYSAFGNTRSLPAGMNFAIVAGQLSGELPGA